MPYRSLENLHASISDDVKVLETLRVELIEGKKDKNKAFTAFYKKFLSLSEKYDWQELKEIVIFYDRICSFGRDLFKEKSYLLAYLSAVKIGLEKSQSNEMTDALFFEEKPLLDPHVLCDDLPSVETLTAIEKNAMF